jgi:DNA modification methylase
VQTCVTSPPYWGLRDYGHAGQIGIEATPEAYVAALVDVFRAVRRVLRDDGTIWVNLGDSYITNPRGAGGAASSTLTGSPDSERRRQRWEANGRTGDPKFDAARQRNIRATGLKHKDLVGIPWMTAFALRADGWYLRSDIVWSKSNAMPESVRDRPTKAHEYLFLLSKSPSYYYDASGVAEALASDPKRWGRHSKKDPGLEAVRPRAMFGETRGGRDGKEFGNGKTRNLRTVWTVATQPYAGAHFATFPPRLIEPCVLAGSALGDIVLDPFFGSGTTGMVAQQHGRRYIGFDLGYADLAEERLRQPTLPMRGVR